MDGAKKYIFLSKHKMKLAVFIRIWWNRALQEKIKVFYGQYNGLRIHLFELQWLSQSAFRTEIIIKKFPPCYYDKNGIKTNCMVSICKLNHIDAVTWPVFSIVPGIKLFCWSVIEAKFLPNGNEWCLIDRLTSMLLYEDKSNRS